MHDNKSPLCHKRQQRPLPLQPPPPTSADSISGPGQSVEELKARVGPHLGSLLHLKTTFISLKSDVVHPPAGFSSNALVSPLTGANAPASSEARTMFGLFAATAAGCLSWRLPTPRRARAANSIMARI